MSVAILVLVVLDKEMAQLQNWNETHDRTKHVSTKLLYNHRRGSNSNDIWGERFATTMYRTLFGMSCFRGQREVLFRVS